MRNSEGQLQAFYADDVELPLSNKENVLERYFTPSLNVELVRRIMHLEQELAHLKSQQRFLQTNHFLKVPNDVAEKIVLAFLRQHHREGESVSPFDVSQATRLPASQVEDVLDQMVEEGRLEHNG